MKRRSFFYFTILLLLSACAEPENPAPLDDGVDTGADDELRDPAAAVPGFDVAEGLEVTLFASEPMLRNPTNIDIDARGRIWVCEALNYRPDYNSQNEWIDAGDRILILEDTDGDGKADAQKVYYQGTDINAALGIMVMDNRVIVSASPNVLMFTDTDGDDQPDSKEVLFSGIGGIQDDHGVHAFVMGPDGRFYFNAGNAGRQILDPEGNPIIDKAGNEVVNNGNPYRQGMVFRTDLDGSDFEVLGHNFRNIYEVAVDAYGTLWQSDNDDDGNRGVRINYVMEYGNYGYQDEMTGAGWNTRRTGMHPDIPLRHWHLNDPGVVPNLLQTGAGSPTGIAVYEGRLLPEVYWDQIVHTDAGPNVARAYPVTDAGAGYDAEIVPIFHSNRDQWFRPSDIAVAPDGSLIVADWYDAVVGGNQAIDQQRGRLFRVAPPGIPYTIPPQDLTTPEGAVEALKSPNLATRTSAWLRLNDWGAEAESALQTLWNEENPRFRARALWLLARIDGRSQHYVDLALQDENPNLRIVGLRVARQLGLDLIPLVERVVEDPSPQVRRDAAIALRHNTSPEAADLWGQLAIQYDGQDRWYLEALGIAADRQWEDYFDAWLAEVGDWKSKPEAHDIIWRARTPKATSMLAALIALPETSEADRLRYFRAFDFHDDARKPGLLPPLLSLDDTEIATLALKHLAVPGQPLPRGAQTTLSRILNETKGTRDFLDLVEQFSVRNQQDALSEMAFDRPESDLAADALRLLLASGGTEQVRQALTTGDTESVVEQLARASSPEALGLLEDVITDNSFDLELRRRATDLMGSGFSGENHLLDMARRGVIPEALKPTAANRLMNAWRTSVREEAAAYFDAPVTADQQALPPIRTLVSLTGDPLAGQEVFQTHCATCHQVNGQGTEFGPELSEIGDKLSEYGLFSAILHPDAGINFGYEGKLVTLSDGKQALGYIVSETDQALELKVVGGATNSYPKSEVTSIEPIATSLMPALQSAMTQQQLVDLVTYLHGLKQAEAPAP